MTCPAYFIEGNYILDFNGVWLPFGLTAGSCGSQEATKFMISMEYGCLFGSRQKVVDRRRKLYS